MRVNISQQMKDILKDYSDEVKDGVIKILEDVGDESANELHSAGTFQGKKYRQGWKSTTEEKRTFTSVKVFNKEHYRLTHLLENGHRIVSKAGEEVGSAKAFPHIAEVNENAQKEAEKRVIDFISKG